MITISDMPDDSLGHILEEMILQGDYRRAAAVCKKWETKVRLSFFTLIPYFHTLFFRDQRIDQSRTYAEQLFSLPLILDNVYRPDQKNTCELAISGCTKIWKCDYDLYGMNIAVLVIKLYAPFGIIKVDFRKITHGCAYCWDNHTFTRASTQGNRDAMYQYLYLLMPCLRGRNLHQTQKCLIREWKFFIFGHSGLNDEECGYADAERSLPPDEIDNVDYMSGYNEELESRY